MGKQETELQKALKNYLEKNPGGECVLAEEFRTASGTITRWANGYSKPPAQAIEQIIKYLKRKTK